MPLLGWPLMVTLGLVVGASSASLFLLWTRVRGRRGLRLIQRFGLLVLVQASTLLLVAAGANNYGYYYGSWSDLVGNGSRVDHVVVSGVSSPTGGSTRNGTTTSPPLQVLPPVLEGWSTPARFATRGEVLSVTVPGLLTGLTAPA